MRVLYARQESPRPRSKIGTGSHPDKVGIWENLILLITKPPSFDEGFVRPAGIPQAPIKDRDGVPSRQSRDLGEPDSINNKTPIFR